MRSVKEESMFPLGSTLIDICVSHMHTPVFENLESAPVSCQDGVCL